jgi:hypothetical protein
MEHRRSDRSNTEMYALIYKNDLMKGIGTITNIGVAGVFIESFISEVDLRQPLEIRCFLDDKSIFEDCRFKTMVIHKNSDGFGVKIEQCDLQARLALLWEIDKSKPLRQRRRLKAV